MSQQQNRSAAAQAERDDCVSRADLASREVSAANAIKPLRTLKHVDSAAISKTPFSLERKLY